MTDLRARSAAGLLLGLVGLGGPATATTTWTVDANTSSLGFTGTAQGEAFTGVFHRFDARIAFDPADLAGSRFEVSIDLASADSQNAERDELLLGDEFFAVNSVAQAEYRADKFQSLGDDRYRADGVLTLKGASQPVPLEFRWQSTAGGAQLDGEALLDRLDFNVGSGDWADPEMIDSEVRVTTTLKLVEANP